MSEKRKRAHRADDKRRAGAGDNVPVTTGETTGAGRRVANIFHDRSNGKGKRAS